jgi:hypothetical protein
MGELAFYRADQLRIDSFDSFLSLSLFLIVTLCMLHSQVAVMVQELQSGLLHMMRTMGLIQHVYWAALYTWNLLLFGLLGGFYIAIGALAGERSYKTTNPGVWVAILLLGTHCQVGLPS